MHLADALAEARRLAIALPAEPVELSAVVGRVLADDVTSLVDLPAGDASLMDGWAVRSADLPGAVTVVGESRAGAPWPRSLGPRQAVAISTGGLLPDGADAVLRSEDGLQQGDQLTSSVALSPGHHVRPGSEDLRRGEVLLPMGTRVAAHHIGAIAAAGHAAVACRGIPRAAVVACGSELLEPGQPPEQGMVFDANRHGLAAQLQAAGAQVCSAVAAPDDARATRRAIEHALDAAHLLVVAGGMSVGAHDHTRAALDDLGLVPSFTRLAVRPGQPSCMGVIGECRVLAVPGNPGAAAIGVHVLGRALLGAEAHQARMPLAAAVDPHPGLSLVLRCRDDDGRVRPIALQSSGSVAPTAQADLLAWIPPGDSPLAAGDDVATWRL
jgi:molybdopterin molybdotransferase